MKNLPFWFPKKSNVIWYFLFIIVFLLSLDFWTWEQAEPLIIGLPFWIWYLIFLTLFTALVFYAFSRFAWSEDK